MAIVRETAPPPTAAAEQSTDREVRINPLRPTALADFVGQQQIKHNLKIMLLAAKKRDEPMPHLLFYGPPGLGKTTLAAIVAQEMGSNLRVCTGPAIDKTGDLAAILSNLQAGDVLFIDEIHRLKKPIEEILYSALEDFALDIVVGSGPGARSMRLQLAPFTLVAATTKLGNIAAPLRDRFGDACKLELYELPDLTQIITRSAKKLEITIDPAAAELIASRGRGTPRVANRLLQRMRDFAHAHGKEHITAALTTEALGNLKIDALGLDHGDTQLLRVIAEKFAGGAVGLSTLAAALGEEKDTISEIREPYLLQLGLIQRTSQGRVLLPAGFAHIGATVPQGFEF